MLPQHHDYYIRYMTQYIRYMTQWSVDPNMHTLLIQICTHRITIKMSFVLCNPADAVFICLLQNIIILLLEIYIYLMIKCKSIKILYPKTYLIHQYKITQLTDSRFKTLLFYTKRATFLRMTISAILQKHLMVNNNNYYMIYHI